MFCRKMHIEDLTNHIEQVKASFAWFDSSSFCVDELLVSAAVAAFAATLFPFEWALAFAVTAKVMGRT
jgi:hypothetical protein